MAIILLVLIAAVLAVMFIPQLAHIRAKALAILTGIFAAIAGYWADAFSWFTGLFGG